MNRIQNNFSLKERNTLRFHVAAKFYVELNNIEEIIHIINKGITQSNNIFILGGGSNTLFSKDYNGIVLKMNIKGVHVLHEDDKSVHVRVGAGEDWPNFVEYAVSKGWGGIENLALVPGTAGAAPVQNIACYGHNLHESLLSVDAINLFDGSRRFFLADECNFGYRTSIFKGELKGQYVIIGIVLKLNKNPKLNISYKSRYESLEDELIKIASPPYTIRDVYNAIVNIRKRKLPDVSTVGTVGSVFKNPLINIEQLEELKKKCPGIHVYPEKNLSYDNIDNCKNVDNKVKIPAAWLIEDMGWAGKRLGNCGIWKTQPLNIVNFGDSTPDEYLSFVNMVSEKVFKEYLIKLETEIVII